MTPVYLDQRIYWLKISHNSIISKYIDGRSDEPSIH